MRLSLIHWLRLISLVEKFNRRLAISLAEREKIFLFIFNLFSLDDIKRRGLGKGEKIVGEEE